MDEPRDDHAAPEEEPREKPARSPWEPPSDGSPQARPVPPDPTGDDVFARLNVLAAETDEHAAPVGPQVPFDAGPPFTVDERDLLGEPERSPSRAATFVAFGVVVLAVLGILMSIAAVKLFTERAAMADALEGSVDRLEMAYGGPAASDTSQRRIAWLRKAINDGDFAQAQAALQQLGAPETRRPSPLDAPGEQPGQPEGPARPGQDDRRELPSPSEDDKLPLKAQVFFEQHPELWEAFFGFSVAIVQMERREMEVGELRELRQEMVDAAELGQTKRVEDLLNQARQRMEGQSAGDRLPPALQAKLQQFGAAMQQAQRERRDPREAVALAQRSERAAQQGDLKRAEELMDRAIAALKSAPRARMPQRPPAGRAGAQPGGMPQMGPEIGLIRFVADMAMNVMRAEERDLTQIWESINIAAGAIREKNAEQIKEILSEAQDAFHVIGQRRRQMQGAIQHAQTQVREAQPGGERERPDAPGRPTQQVIVERITGILTTVREMSDEEFAGSRVEIAKAVLAAMTAPVQPEPEQAAEAPDLTPEQRVRAKMERAGRVYMQLRERSDADMSTLDEAFRKVRELIAEHDYARAEELVDEAFAMMRAIAGDIEGERDAPTGPEDYGPQLQFDAPRQRLELQGLGERVHSPAPDLSHDTDEGAEQ